MRRKSDAQISAPAQPGYVRAALMLVIVIASSLLSSLHADAAHMTVKDGLLRPRPMPPTAVPIAFAMPDGCELFARVQTSQMAPGEDGTLIHWMTRCPTVRPSDMPTYFARSLSSQGWTLTVSDHERFVTYFRDDLELILDFGLSVPATSSAWMGQRYWR
jgi:hypothetical protein